MAVAWSTLYQVELIEPKILEVFCTSEKTYLCFKTAFYAQKRKEELISQS